MSGIMASPPPLLPHNHHRHLGSGSRVLNGNGIGAFSSPPSTSFSQVQDRNHGHSNPNGEDRDRPAQLAALLSVAYGENDSLKREIKALQRRLDAAERRTSGLSSSSTSSGELDRLRAQLEAETARADKAETERDTIVADIKSFAEPWNETDRAVDVVQKALVDARAKLTGLGKMIGDATLFVPTAASPPVPSHLAANGAIPSAPSHPFGHITLPMPPQLAGPAALISTSRRRARSRSQDANMENPHASNSNLDTALNGASPAKRHRTEEPLNRTNSIVRSYDGPVPEFHSPGRERERESRKPHPRPRSHSREGGRHIGKHPHLQPGGLEQSSGSTNSANPANVYSAPRQRRPKSTASTALPLPSTRRGLERDRDRSVSRESSSSSMSLDKMLLEAADSPAPPVPTSLSSSGRDRAAQRQLGPGGAGGPLEHHAESQKYARSPGRSLLGLGASGPNGGLLGGPGVASAGSLGMGSAGGSGSLQHLMNEDYAKDSNRALFPMDRERERERPLSRGLISQGPGPQVYSRPPSRTRTLLDDQRPVSVIKPEGSPRAGSRASTLRPSPQLFHQQAQQSQSQSQQSQQHQSGMYHRSPPQTAATLPGPGGPGGPGVPGWSSANSMPHISGHRQGDMGGPNSNPEAYGSWTSSSVTSISQQHRQHDELAQPQPRSSASQRHAFATGPNDTFPAPPSSSNVNFGVNAYSHGGPIEIPSQNFTNIDQSSVFHRSHPGSQQQQQQHMGHEQPPPTITSQSFQPPVTGAPVKRNKTLSYGTVLPSGSPAPGGPSMNSSTTGLPPGSAFGSGPFPPSTSPAPMPLSNIPSATPTMLNIGITPSGTIGSIPAASSSTAVLGPPASTASLLLSGRENNASGLGPGGFPATNDAGQRICRQCGHAGRYKDGKCVEKWGPGPEGPGTVCDRCRKKMKRVEKRGSLGGAAVGAVSGAAADGAAKGTANTGVEVDSAETGKATHAGQGSVGSAIGSRATSPVPVHESSNGGGKPIGRSVPSRENPYPSSVNHHGDTQSQQITHTRIQGLSRVHERRRAGSASASTASYDGLLGHLQGDGDSSSLTEEGELEKDLGLEAEERSRSTTRRSPASALTTTARSSRAPLSKTISPLSGHREHGQHGRSTPHAPTPVLAHSFSHPSTLGANSGNALGPRPAASGQISTSRPSSGFGPTIRPSRRNSPARPTIAVLRENGESGFDHDPLADTEDQLQDDNDQDNVDHLKMEDDDVDLVAELARSVDAETRQHAPAHTSSRTRTDHDVDADLEAELDLDDESIRRAQLTQEWKQREREKERGRDLRRDGSRDHDSPTRMLEDALDDDMAMDSVDLDVSGETEAQLVGSSARAPSLDELDDMGLGGDDERVRTDIRVVRVPDEDAEMDLLEAVDAAEEEAERRRRGGSADSR